MPAIPGFVWMFTKDKYGVGTRVMETTLLSGALGHQRLISELSRSPFYFCGSAEASEIKLFENLLIGFFSPVTH